MTLSLFPPQASTEAGPVDFIYFATIALSSAIFGIVLVLLVVFAVRYRRGSKVERGDLPDWIERDFEIGWTSATIFLFLFGAWWTASTRLAALIAPARAMEIHVVAKQWMWKTQHPTGEREINALHVPVGESVRLVMTSQDVIHSFFVPEFRVKQDVLPGRYTRLWFNATKTGTYHLFCTQLCGTEHARMVGDVVVMARDDYTHWLQRQPHQDDLVQQGGALYRTLGCSGCHDPGAKVDAPPLAGLYGKSVALEGSPTIQTVDDSFIRDKILRPNAHAVKGYPQIMPTYAGLVGDEELGLLVAYIRSLGTVEAGGPR